MKFARAALVGLLAALIAAAPAAAAKKKHGKAKPRVHHDSGALGARLHTIAARTGHESEGAAHRLGKRLQELTGDKSADDTVSRLKRAFSSAGDDFSRNFNRLADRIRAAFSSSRK
ncbi:MAG: hypothetical protein HKL90_04845 [Elusimicrobia bacterium]|nr:hypothetical protein [Elusimicrobiota bacterium]